MKALSLEAVLIVVMAVHTPAATLYVSLNSTNPVPPYSDWSIAATNIQDAAAAAAHYGWLNSERPLTQRGICRMVGIVY